jgi:demethylmenaquinone methyltransferase/2-methoxy-6-polyprenyl-1,4-benzoquinol methylase
VRGLFARIAPGYDSFNRVSSFGVDRGWRKATVEAAHLDRGSRVLDLCAGTGDLTLALAEGGTHSTVIGSDFVPEMLEIAEEKAKAYTGPADLSFQIADAQDLPFDDQTFDVVTVAFGVRNLPDREANFREVHRVLKPGGRYVILEFSRPPLAPYRWGYYVYLKTVVPAIGALLAQDRGAFVYLNDSIKQFPRQEGLAAELRAAGFTAISWQNRTGGVAAIHTAVK